MTEYEIVPGSHGQRRSFRITVALQPGYAGATAYPVGDVEDEAERWMLEQAQTGGHILTGVVSTGNVIYAWPGEFCGSGREPVAVFAGEVSNLYSGDMTDDDAVCLLNTLAGRLGRLTGQVRVYVSYRDQAWVLQLPGTVTPRGDTL